MMLGPFKAWRDVPGNEDVVEELTKIINAVEKVLAQETALQALHDENERLGLYQDAYAQPEPDELNIAYMSGLYDGKKKRPWVGLTDEEMMECDMDEDGFGNARPRAKLNVQAKLKEKNGG